MALRGINSVRVLILGQEGPVERPFIAKSKEVSSVALIKLDIDDRFPAEKALKKFKRLCDAYGIVKEYRARSEYKKPSVKTKEKLENAVKRRRKTDSRTRKFSSKF